MLQIISQYKNVKVKKDKTTELSSLEEKRRYDS